MTTFKSNVFSMLCYVTISRSIFPEFLNDFSVSFRHRFFSSLVQFCNQKKKNVKKPVKKKKPHLNIEHADCKYQGMRVPRLLCLASLLHWQGLLSNLPPICKIRAPHRPRFSQTPKWHKDSPPIFF